MFQAWPFPKPWELATKLQETLTVNSSQEFYYEHFPDQTVSLFDSYALIKTGSYFVLLALINKVAPLLTRYRVPGAILQLLMQSLPTFLYLTNMNGEGLRQVLYNSLPYWLRPYIISTSYHGTMSSPSPSWSFILSFILAVAILATLSMSILMYLASYLYQGILHATNRYPDHSSQSTTQTVILNNISKLHKSKEYDIAFNLCALAQQHFRTFPEDFKTEAHKVNYLAKQLQGPSLTWFCEASIRDSDLCTNYKEFVDRLLKHLEMDEEEDIESPSYDSRFSHCTQGTSTLAEYNKKFKDIQKHIKATNEEACYYYMAGLHPDLKTFLVHHDLPDEIKLLIKEVTKWDKKFQTTQKYKTSKTSQPVSSTTSFPKTTPTMTLEPKSEGGFKLSTSEHQRRRENNLCLYCGSDAHKISSCDAPGKKNRPVFNRPSSSSAVVTNSTLNQIQSKNTLSLPFVQITIQGKNSSVKTYALLDTGADASYIDQRLAEAIQLVPDKPVCATGANGSNITSFSLQEPTVFQLGSAPFSSPFIQASSLQFPVYLGMDWCEENNVVINCQERLASFTCLDKPKSIDLLRREELPSNLYQFHTLNSISSQETMDIQYEDSGIPTFLASYASVFNPQESKELPPRRPYDMKINLIEGTTPPWGRIIPLSTADNNLLLDYINEELEKGFIERSTSPCSSPIFFVGKSDGSKRPCIDFRALNAITIKDRCPIPSAEALTDCLAGSQIFSKVDLKAAFNQIRIAEGHEWKTAFRTPFGLYQYKVMPFGLCNAPSTFQALMNEVLLPYLNQFVVVYLDDILIFSKSVAEHKEHLRLVLERLQSYNLFCKPSKCSFFQSQVEFLGYIVTREGFAISPSKLDAIMNWPVPKTRKALRGFIGLANYCRKFIPNFSEIILPLTNLTSNKVDFVWSEEAQSSFTLVRQAFVSPPVLIMPDMAKPFVLETDASDYAVGAVLLQLGGDDMLHPVAFFSQKHLPAERNYPVHDKELLAIIKALKHWRRYLEGTTETIQIHTDHKSLLYFTQSKLVSQRHARWILELTNFNISIHYKKGVENIVPDQLSRRPDLAASDEEYEKLNTAIVLPQSLFINQITTFLPNIPDSYSIMKSQEKDLQLAKIIKDISTNDPELDPLYSLDNGILYYNKAAYVPDKDLQLQIIIGFHDSLPAGHLGYKKTLARIRPYYYWPHLPKDIKEYTSSCLVCTRNKNRPQKQKGLLNPLPIPEGPWQSLSMDYITQLPPSEDYDAILVIVDRFSKEATFCPCTSSVTASETAKMFIKYVFPHHGVPRDIVSDRGPQFTSVFWRELMTSLGVTSLYSTAYHPQTDGQTERTNQTLEQYLRCFINDIQDNWADLLPIAQFSYNSASHSSIGMSPLQANLGYNPTFMPSLTNNFRCQSAEELAILINQTQFALKENLALAQERYKHHYDKKKSPQDPIFPGDQVFLASRNLPVILGSRKFRPRYIGPYQVLETIGKAAFRLQLPSHFKIHNVFHVSLLLKLRKEPPKHQAKIVPPALHIQGTPEFEVQEILASRTRNSLQEFLVHWKGYQLEDSTWEPTANLVHCSELVKEFKSTSQDPSA